MRKSYPGGAVGPIALLAAGACLWSVWVGAAQPLPFATGVVERRALLDERRFDGRVEAVFRSTISAQTAGEIVELPFDVNDFVPKDSVVLRFDATKQQAVLEKAKASELEASARRAEAQSAHERNLRLIKDNAVSRSQLEKSEADLKAAQAKLKQAAAGRAEAQEQLEYTVVKAPYTGVLVERFVEIGEQVQVGQRLGTGLSLEKLRVEVEVPARYVETIRASGAARIELPGSETEWLTAENLTVFPYADSQSHSFTVRLALPQGQHGLYPGMFARVAFALGDTPQLVVPSRAVVHRSEVTGVYVVDAGQQVQFRQIRAGRAASGDLTRVMAGLEAGERVALDPVAAVIYLKQQHVVSDHE